MDIPKRDKSSTTQPSSTPQVKTKKTGHDDEVNDLSSRWKTHKNNRTTGKNERVYGNENRSTDRNKRMTDKNNRTSEVNNNSNSKINGTTGKNNMRDDHNNNAQAENSKVERSSGQQNQLKVFRPTLLSNKVYHMWYRRYPEVLPEHERIEYQPFEEIDKREEDIAMEFVYGNEPPLNLGVKKSHIIRREAVAKYQAYQDRINKRTMAGQVSVPNLMPKQSESSDMAGNPADYSISREFKMLTKDGIAKVKDIALYWKYKRVIEVRKKRIEEKKQRGFDIMKTKWSLLFKEINQIAIKKMYRIFLKNQARLRFKKIIALVYACNRFFKFLYDVSGDTGNLVKETREFQERMVSKSRSLLDVKDQKFIFQPDNYKLSDRTPVSRETMYSLTTRWFHRTDESVTQSIQSLQSLRCFAELPKFFQRLVAKVGWFISVPPNKVIIRQGQQAHDFYIIMCGRVSKTVLSRDGGDNKGPALFRHLHTFNKDSIFGEEAMTNPGSLRDYSAMSCTMCDMLSINIHDYFECTMVPSNSLSPVPDHIQLISRCSFLKKLEKNLLMEFAEGNVHLAYFAPNTVIEYSMKTSKWVYVVKWGSCRTICEMAPGGKVIESEKKSDVILASQTINLMVNRMTEPVRIESSASNTTLDRVKNIRNEMEAHMTTENSGLKVTSSVDKNIDEQVFEINEKRGRISKIIDAQKNKTKQKQVIEHSKSKLSIRSENNPGRTPSPVRSVKGSVKTSSTLARPNQPKKRSTLKKTSNFDSQQQIPKKQHGSMQMKQKKQRDSNNSNKTEDEKIEQKSVELPAIIENRPSHSDSLVMMKKRSSQSSGSGKRFSLPNLKLSASSGIPEGTQGSQTTEESSTLKLSPSTNVGGRPIPTGRRKTRVSIEEEMLDPRVENRPKRSFFNVDEKLHTAEHSNWKLKKNLVKGDSCGFEYINLGDGKYRPPDEQVSLVSDGCELAMVRRSFLISHMAVQRVQNAEFD